MAPLENLLGNVIAVVVYALLGMLLLGAGFWAVDRLTPGTVWKEIIEEHNTALAVLMGAVVLAFAVIIAAAVVG